jgi:glutaredoxin
MTGRSKGSEDKRSVSVVLYHAPGCHLCAAARRVLDSVRAEQEFDLREVDIEGDPELEARYREWLPVVEIDGERAFTYFVYPDALRAKLAQAGVSNGTL